MEYSITYKAKKLISAKIWVSIFFTQIPNYSEYEKTRKTEKFSLLAWKFN